MRAGRRTPVPAPLALALAASHPIGCSPDRGSWLVGYFCARCIIALLRRYGRHWTLSGRCAAWLRRLVAPRRGAPRCMPVSHTRSSRCGYRWSADCILQLFYPTQAGMEDCSFDAINVDLRNPLGKSACNHRGDVLLEDMVAPGKLSDLWITNSCKLPRGAPPRVIFNHRSKACACATTISKLSNAVLVKRRR